MALVYRAVWDTNLADASKHGLEAFRSWVHEKYPDLVIPDEGFSPPYERGVDAGVIQASADGVDAIRATLHEERQTERWTTTLTILEEPSATSFWVDLELVCQDAFQLPDPEPPRLVPSLLELAPDSHRGPVVLRSSARTWDGDHVPALVKLVLDPARDIPIVVFTPDPDGGLMTAERRAASAARTLAGVATVEVLGAVAVTDFTSGVGQSLGVWGGAVRTYLPGVGQGDSTYRHFFLTAAAISRDTRDAGRFIARRLAISNAARRAPATYEQVRPQLQGRHLRQTLDATETQYLEALEEKEQLRSQLEEEKEQLRSQLQSEEDLRIRAVGDLEEANAELEIKIAQIGRLTKALRGANVAEDAWAEDEAPADLLGSCREAAVRAQKTLQGVVIPDSALTTIGELDVAVESTVWGQTSWRALRALSAYAQDAGSSSGFWDWCKNSSNPYVWPASPKKLAMVESDTVMNNPDLRSKRVFAVDRQVDKSGSILMTAHMKVAEGGGPLAPRVYFYDDTKGVTGKVHVGFFGPHRFLPNASTN